MKTADRRTADDKRRRYSSNKPSPPIKIDIARKVAFIKGSRLNANVINASDTVNGQFPASLQLCVAGSLTPTQTIRNNAGNKKNKASGSPTLRREIKC
jgi:hypothetical protein